MRVGIGYDIHQVTPERPLLLGGIMIPDGPGLAGHSDADVLLHAICDALLGAAGFGDIGEHFPDTDPALAGIDSAVLLERTIAMVRSDGWYIENIDSIIFAEIVKISPWKARMKERIGALLKIDPMRINIKAKTMEHCDAVGCKEAVAASCVILLSRVSSPAKGA